MIAVMPLVLEDLSEVLKIEEASFPRPFSRKLFETELQLSIAHLYAAKQDGALVGYIDFWDAGAELHLINIAVAPDKRRLGIGSLLMDRLVQYSRGNRIFEIYLDVRVSNQPAISLYDRFGFQKFSIRKGYYQDNNEDALVMCLRLAATGEQSG